MRSLSFNHALTKSLILFVTTVSLTYAAEWSGSLQTGYSYTDNLGSQITVDQGLGTSDVESRNGWANQGNLVLQSLSSNGGQAFELFGLYDKSDEQSKDITNLVFSASLFRALSVNWLWRISGEFNSYRYDPAPISSYDGYGANLTFGYFGNKKQGMDLKLAWKFENHNQNESLTRQYKTNRIGLNLIYYLPHSKEAVLWSIQGHARRNINENDDFRDYNSYLLGIGAGNWTLGKVQGFAGLQWRSNYYDEMVNTTQNATSNTQSPGSMAGGGQMGGPGGGGMGGGENNNTPIISSQDVNDQLLSAMFIFTYPFSRHWSVRLSANASHYSTSVGADDNLYSVFTGLRWGF